MIKSELKGEGRNEKMSDLRNDGGFKYLLCVRHATVFPVTHFNLSNSSYALAPYGCHNKLTQTWWLKIKYSFLNSSGSQRSKTSFTGLKTRVGRAVHVPLEALGENPLLYQHSLTFGHINPIPTATLHSLWSKVSLWLSLWTPVNILEPIQVIQDNLLTSNSLI